MTNETQEIDAGALRARLAETPADLRGRIEAALRARHGATARLVKYPTERDRALWVAGWKGGDASQMAHSATPDADALAALAVAVGLSADGHDPRAEVDALARRLHAEREAVVAELDRTREEVDALESLVARQADILTGVANALRGDPGPLASHSHHDLAERAAAMVALLAVTQSSLEAASSGRRVTACDDIERLQRERDAAECERDALYDTAREWARAEDALTAAIVAADGPDTDGAYAAAVTRRNAAHAALRDALAALVGGAS